MLLRLLIGLLLCCVLPSSFAMRVVLQRVTSASVTVDGAMVSSIGRGIMALVGLHERDTAEDMKYCARKLVQARLWENEDGKTWRKSAKQMEYEILCVSQFTLYGSIENKKHVPDFKLSMKNEAARAAYEAFKEMVVAEYGNGEKIKDGVFAAKMDVALVNDGPVTLVIDTTVKEASPAAAADAGEGSVEAAVS